MRIEIEPLIKIITVTTECLFALVRLTGRVGRLFRRKPKQISDDLPTLERRPDETSDQIQEQGEE